MSKELTMEGMIKSIGKGQGFDIDEALKTARYYVVL